VEQHRVGEAWRACVALHKKGDMGPDERLVLPLELLHACEGLLQEGLVFRVALHHLPSGLERPKKARWGRGKDVQVA